MLLATGIMYPPATPSIIQFSNFIIRFCSLQGAEMSMTHFQPFSNVPAAIPVFFTRVMLLMVILPVLCWLTMPRKEFAAFDSAVTEAIGASNMITELTVAAIFLERRDVFIDIIVNNIMIEIRPLFIYDALSKRILTIAFLSVNGQNTVTNMLTKTDFMNYIECPMYLWLSKHRPDLLPQDTPEKERIFAMGRQVDELAKKLFEGGVE